jgi:SAM-dependent methyltransferase
MTEPVDSFDGVCAVCGEQGTFCKDCHAVSESYRCPHCRGLLRYQGQARVLVERLAKHGSTSFAALCREPEFSALRIWEPGLLGPFRSYLADLPGNIVSTYWPGVASGELRGGVQCQDLMALSFESESIDVIITSDIFEHVRKPFVGFAEVHRALRPGGLHVFSVPGYWPLRRFTRPRVDVSGDADVFLEVPDYHGELLVYTDFGQDLPDRLAVLGFETSIRRFEGGTEATSGVVTFCSVKTGARGSALPPPPTMLHNAIAGDGSATLSWESADSHYPPVSGYEVTAYDGYFPQLSVRFNSTETTQTIGGLTNGTTYRFKVAAINLLGIGPTSKASNPVVPSRSST